MDKRSFLFVILVTVTLGLTNYWFDTQRQTQLAEWEEQQKARKEQLAKTQLEEGVPSTTEAEKIAAPASLDSAETYYVLENDYQQLVFSTKGGSLAEINLPFKSAADEESAVKEIEYDRDMVKDHPYNAHFPAHPYFTPGEDPKGNYVRHEEGKLGGFYPLIRRDLIQVPPRKTVDVPSKYYAANIVSEYPELAEARYTVTHFDKNSITFESVSYTHLTLPTTSRV